MDRGLVRQARSRRSHPGRTTNQPVATPKQIVLASEYESRAKAFYSFPGSAWERAASEALPALPLYRLVSPS